MTNTYNDSSGVMVNLLKDNDIASDPPEPELSEYEYQLTTTLIWMTLDIQDPEHAYVGVDVRAVESSLQCFDYTSSEATVIAWATLKEIGRRCCDE